MNTFSKQLFSALFGLAMLSSCSRQVAYFQPSAREHIVSTAPQAAPLIAPQTSVDQAPVVVTNPAQQLAQTTATLDQVDALVSNNNKLAANKTVQKRLNRVRALLSTASTKASLTSTEVAAPRKMNLMERLMVKKMNKKISKQLAPNNPEKAMMNSSVLAAGAVLVIIGIVLLLIGSSGTAAVILLLAGAVVLLVGLL